MICLGLALAMILNRSVFGSGVFRTLFYLPNVLSTAVIGLLFVAVQAALLGQKSAEQALGDAQARLMDMASLQ